ncbi:hypothetical protein [Microbulbifer sp. 2205BS26-8]|uniref:hypothetical protein n=1 Tax=Microbulbifer sp. 2205BS26-8 TaxID=3064386 RepID=UPI00273DB6DB|nr:hypothetical protein [Microbulbifer sp. 2205BS26-8]MDP5211224.1 hypothetical protein [Microbulbifer sp. 2205BS26-8]
MTVHIIGNEGDYHSVAVHWGLKKLGLHSHIWATPGYRQSQSMTMKYPKFDIVLGGVKLNKSDTVWIRRPLLPEIHPNTSDLDKKFCTNEYKEAFDGLLNSFEYVKLCANSYKAQRQMERKAMQLRIAFDSDFLIPKTIITNNQDEAKEFINQLSSSCIYKTFLPHIWDSEEKRTLNMTATTKINIDDLNDAFIAQSSPLILQEYIDKLHDVRVTVMGKVMIAVAIVNKNKLEAPPVDWRPKHNHTPMSIVCVTIPEKIKNKIILFMERAGLAFSCLDFSIDKMGEWWFLESNATGQFLWIEDDEKKLNMLSIFCSFLSSGDKNFNCMKINSSINLIEFEKSEEFINLQKTSKLGGQSFITKE